MNRRRALVFLGTALTSGMAGCSGGDGEANQTPTDAQTSTQTGTQAGTRTGTSTPTQTPTTTQTQTQTQTPTEPTHELGESFTVGEGSSAVGFTFRRFFRAQELGPTRTEQAQETFLIVILTVKNPQSETIDVPSPEMNLRAPGVIKNVDDPASEAAGSDSRLDVPSIANTTITAGQSVTGVIAYDAPSGHDYRIVIKPRDPDAGPAHAVPVGNLADLDPLPTGY